MKKCVFLYCILFVLAGLDSKILASPINAEIHSKPVFPTPLQWIGNIEPAGNESGQLLHAINVFETNGPEGGIPALESFTSANPQSAWTPSIEVSLAEYYRGHAAYSKALQSWEKAWNATKNASDPVSQVIAVRAAAGWTRLLASLGRKEDADRIFAELNRLSLPLGAFSASLGDTESGIVTMKSQPGMSYRCGTLALSHVAQVLHVSRTNILSLVNQQSPLGGFKVSQLLALSRSNGMDLVAVHRPPGSDVVVPSVIHWKLNHYAAIVGIKGERYKIMDPTFQGYVYADKATIDAEGSGVFLLPRNLAPKSWKELTPVECDTFYGKGYPNLMDSTKNSGPSCDDTEDGGDSANDLPAPDTSPDDGDKVCTDCPSNSPTGMPVWSVSQPYTAVWLKDIPLRYRMSGGTWMNLTVRYKQGGEDKGPNIGSFGPMWECNWLAFLSSDGTTDAFTNHMGGGGLASFPTDGGVEYKTVRHVVIPSDPVRIETGVEAYRKPTLTYPPMQTTLSGVTNYFARAQTDPYDRTTLYSYETNAGILRLKYVVDRDGRTNVLAYNNAGFPNLITDVTNAYQQNAHFHYDGTGRLTNIIDAAGNASYFYYDSSDNITNMVTPYGSTLFNTYTGVSTNYENSMRRALLITEPTGDQQLYEYCDAGPWAPAADGENYFRQSYHWNRAQFAFILAEGISNILDMPDAYYANASVVHFLHGDNDPDGSLTVSDTVNDQAGPALPDGARPMTSYDYEGQGAYSIGSIRRVVSMTTPLGSAKDFSRDANGAATNITIYGPSGAITYTNNFDVNGGRLLQIWGPSGELVHGYGYAAALTNLLTSDTNAMGYVTSYTYDTNLVKLITTTFPSGLVRSNTYYSTGPNAGLLLSQMDLGIATNSFGYQNGNISVMTNALGLETTYLYDNLNRLICTTFPDGTTISNVYDKLDIVGVKDRLNHWTQYQYNSLRELTALTNVNNQVTQYSYCGCGALTEEIRYNGATPLTTIYQYDIAGNRTNIIYPDLYQLSISYDDEGMPYLITDGAGHSEYYEFAQFGESPLINHIDLNGLVMYQPSFDEYGRVTNNINENGTSIGTAFDFLNRITSQVRYNYDVAEGPETFNYSARGLTNYVDPIGRPETFARDIMGRTVATANANNETNGFTYNPFGKLLRLVDGLGHSTLFAYDQYDRLTNKIDGLGNTVASFQYDPLSRLTNRWTPEKGNTAYAYDNVGSLTNVSYSMTNVLGTSTNLSFAYDGLNRLTAMSDAIGETTYGWTPGDQLAQEDGPWSGDAVTYAYADRLRSAMAISSPNSSTWTQTYGYDDQKRLNAIASPAGLFTYGYGGNNFHRYNGLNISPLYYSVSQTFDGLGRLTETLATFGVSDDIQYKYDAASEITNDSTYLEMGTAHPGSQMNYGYDNIGQLKTAQGFEADGTTPRLNEQFGYSYDQANNLSNRTNNNLLETFSVNNANELSTLSRSGTFTVTGNATEFEGGYYGSGNPSGVTNVTVSGTGLSPGPAQLYMDGSWARTNTTLSNGINSYTAVGQDTYGRQDTNSVTVNMPANVILLYDLNGNLRTNGTRIFDYDSENQLIRITEPGSWKSEFIYDGMNRRRIDREYSWQSSSWVQTNETHYVYDGSVVVQERDISNFPQITYTRGADLSGSLQGAGGIGGLLARTDNALAVSSVTASSAHAYYYSDGRGNVVLLVNQNGAVLAKYKYSPFGDTISMEGPLAPGNVYRFSSKEYHLNSGLYSYLFRFYDPHVQRWLNRDPIAEIGGINLFSYVANSPIGFIDPYGLTLQGALTGAQWGDEIGGWIGGVLGTGGGVAAGATGGTAVEPVGGTIVGGGAGALEGGTIGAELGAALGATVGAAIGNALSDLANHMAGKKENLLPSGGTCPYRPKKQKGGGNPRNKQGDYLDDKGNGWRWDPNKAEWDVQHPDGSHTNVGTDGDITHKENNF